MDLFCGKNSLTAHDVASSSEIKKLLGDPSKFSELDVRKYEETEKTLKEVLRKYEETLQLNKVLEEEKMLLQKNLKSTKEDLKEQKIMIEEKDEELGKVLKVVEELKEKGTGRINLKKAYGTISGYFGKLIEGDYEWDRKVLRIGDREGKKLYFDGREYQYEQISDSIIMVTIEGETFVMKLNPVDSVLTIMVIRERPTVVFRRKKVLLEEKTIIIEGDELKIL